MNPNWEERESKLSELESSRTLVFSLAFLVPAGEGTIVKTSKWGRSIVFNVALRPQTP